MLGVGECTSQGSLESERIWNESLQESSSLSVPHGWVSQLVSCICWDPEEVESSASGEWMC